MRVGIWSDLRNPPQWRRPWAELYGRTLERIEEAERLGLDAVWLTEHHFFEDGYLPQPLTFAAAIAARTERMRIGTAILLAPLRPAVDIAEQGAIVDLVSNGRLELGLGAGYRVLEFKAFGVDMADRFPLLEERAREVRRLWDEGGIVPGPVQVRPRIWIGANGARGARMAGRLGEGLMWLDPEKVAVYLDALRAAGHDESAARVSGSVNLIVSSDPERAWDRIAPHLVYQWETYARYGAEGAEKADALVVDQASTLSADDMRSAGPAMLMPSFDVVTPDEAVRRMRAWLADLPVLDVYFWDSIAGMPDDLVDEHVELLAREVAPAVRDLGLAVPGQLR
jgi:alkanesulfonate monooxygenase SsuD/methylene tetrahydromethanopterin reductase-like flavin-dependent oxidoreductase (luciferase family)